MQSGCLLHLSEGGEQHLVFYMQSEQDITIHRCWFAGRLVLPSGARSALWLHSVCRAQPAAHRSQGSETVLHKAPMHQYFMHICCSACNLESHQGGWHIQLPFRTQPLVFSLPTERFCRCSSDEGTLLMELTPRAEQVPT